MASMKALTVRGLMLLTVLHLQWQLMRVKQANGTNVLEGYIQVTVLGLLASLRFLDL